MFSCEYYVTFKDTNFEKHPQIAASAREELILYQWDFEVLPLRYNENFTISFQSIFHLGSFVGLQIILLRNVYIYAINIKSIVDAYSRF